MTRIRETICHGDFSVDRYEDVDLADDSSVAELMNSCPFLLFNAASKVAADSAALVSRTREEIIAGRTKVAKRVALELQKTGESSIGWVTYVVLND